MAIYSVFSHKKMVIFHSYVNVYRRVYPNWSSNLSIPEIDNFHVIFEVKKPGFPVKIFPQTSSVIGVFRGSRPSIQVWSPVWIWPRPKRCPMLISTSTLYRTWWPWSIQRRWGATVEVETWPWGIAKYRKHHGMGECSTLPSLMTGGSGWFSQKIHINPGESIRNRSEEFVFIIFFRFF